MQCRETCPCGPRTMRSVRWPINWRGLACPPLVVPACSQTFCLNLQSPCWMGASAHSSCSRRSPGSVDFCHSTGVTLGVTRRLKVELPHTLSDAAIRNTKTGGNTRDRRHAKLVAPTEDRFVRDHYARSSRNSSMSRRLRLNWKCQRTAQLMATAGKRCP